MNLNYFASLAFFFLFLSPSFAQKYIARVEEDGKGWYLINDQGQRVGTGTYTHIGPFSDGMAAVRKNGKWGYINSKGENIIEIKYDFTGYFSCGIAKVSLYPNVFYYINKEGKRISTDNFVQAYPCSDSLFFGILKGQYEFRLFNCLGKELNPNNTYEEIIPFKKGQANVKMKRNLWQVINTKGEVLHQGDYKTLSTKQGGMYKFETSKGWGFLDSSFQVAIPAQYKFAWQFCNGYVRIKDDLSNSRPVILDKKGTVMNWDYVEIGNFSEGLIRFRDPKKRWGFLNTNGKEIIPATFLAVKDFKEGICLVKDENSNWGYIDANGKWIIQPNLKGAKNCKNGYLLVKFEDGLWRFMNKSGKVFTEKYVHAYPFDKIDTVGEEEEESETEEK